MQLLVGLHWEFYLSNALIHDIDWQNYKPYKVKDLKQEIKKLQKYSNKDS